MSVSYWLDRSNLNKTKTQNYDVVIVGGGIAGLSAAFWLNQEDPSLRIAILEKNHIGSGASGRNAGFVTCGSTEHFIKLRQQFGLEKAVAIWKFSEENRHLLMEHIIQDQADLLDFRHTGSCTVAPHPESWENYKATAAVMKSQGIDVVEIGPQDLESQYGVRGFEGAIQYNGDGYIHPIKLINHFKSKITADLHEFVEVFALEEIKSHQVLRTNMGSFTCSKVLLTMNAYLPLLFKDYLHLVTPGRGQILVTEPLPQFVKGPCYLTKHLCYFRQLPSGHLLIGGFRNLATETENTFADETTPLIQEALLQFAKNHFKLGAQIKPAYQWSGIMGFTLDGQMLIGPHKNNPQVHLMAGCSGHGMGLSFNAARTLVNSLYGRPIPAHFNISRFK